MSHQRSSRTQSPESAVPAPPSGCPRPASAASFSLSRGRVLSFFSAPEVSFKIGMTAPSGGQRVAQHGFEQTAAVGFVGGELGFELVAQRHQFIDLGDDTVLL